MDSPPPVLRLAALEKPPAPGGAPSTTAPQEQLWSSFLPFFAEEVRRMGYELPLPFGVSAIYNYLSRDIEVTDVRVGVNGAAPDSVSQFANFNARGDVSGVLVKADAWIFPFLDVYLLLGYIHNVTDVNVQVTVPRPGPIPGNRQFNISTKVVLCGFVGGGGVTLAGGYCQFFVMANVNYSQTELGFDDRFRALIASARAGWNGKVGSIPLRLWVGGATSPRSMCAPA